MAEFHLWALETGGGRQDDFLVPIAGTTQPEALQALTAALQGVVDGAQGTPDTTTLPVGGVTLRVLAGVLVVYWNDAGTIKSLAIGELG